MKKITAILIAALLCLGTVLALASCNDKPADTTAASTTKAAESTKEVTEEVTTEAATTEEVTTEAATTAEQTTNSGAEINYEEDEIELFIRRDNNDSHDPVQADSGRELACKFTIPEGSRLTGLFFESCPTWMAVDYSGFVVELYKWDNDYENTLVGDVLYSEEFEEWVDNASCELDFTDKAPSGFASGTYLYVFKGTTDKIGVWAMDAADDCEYFENGVGSGHGFQVIAYVLTPVA